MAALVGMWRSTRMVVLTAICAALYAAILIPFKVVPLIPGVTEFRPANAVPIVCSFLFGPAAAWGAAFGNLIGEFFGGLGPGDVFGFVGNLAYGFVPYAVWGACTDAPPVGGGPLRLAGFVLVVALASALCAVVIGWGLHALGFHPFTLLAPIVFLNDFLVAVVLAPLLLRVLYPRIARARLLYADVFPAAAPRPRGGARLGVVLVAAGTVAAFATGELTASGRWRPPWAVVRSESGAAEVGIGLLPPLGTVLVGLALL
jgi:energy-coupling factor transport system substrate-specific component